MTRKADTPPPESPPPESPPPAGPAQPVGLDVPDADRQKPVTLGEIIGQAGN